MPVDKMIGAFYPISRKHQLSHTTNGFAPVVDGNVLPQHPFHPQASARGLPQSRADGDAVRVVLPDDQRSTVLRAADDDRGAALGKAPVHCYYFTWETPVQGGRLKSPHALEIAFVFDNTERSSRFTGGGPRAAALADKMADAWIAFARTGNPNTSKLPMWTPYTSAQQAAIKF